MAKTLAELKAENAAKENDGQVEAEVINPETKEDNPEQQEKPPESEEDNPEILEGKSEELEPWQKVNDEKDKTSDKVPLKTYLRKKKDYKLKLTNKDTEIEKLREENEQLKNTPVVAEKNSLKRPIEYEYDTVEEYHSALEDYDNKRFQEMDRAKTERTKLDRFKEDQKKALSQHYERAEELIETAGIDPENYRNADSKVRSAFEAIAPQRGDMIVDDIISKMGKGSEKVLFFLGRNDADLAIAQQKLINDPSGLELAFHLGGENKKLTKPRKQTTKAPPPAPNLSGGGGLVAGDEEKLEKGYKAAVKSNDPQKMFDLRRAAKKKGVNVSSW